MKEFSIYKNNYGQYEKVINKWIEDMRKEYQEEPPISVVNHQKAYTEKTGEFFGLKEAIDEYLDINLAYKSRLFFYEGQQSPNRLRDILYDYNTRKIKTEINKT